MGQWGLLLGKMKAFKHTSLRTDLFKAHFRAENGHWGYNVPC